jgi:hypothetical protein
MGQLCVTTNRNPGPTGSPRRGDSPRTAPYFARCASFGGREGDPGRRGARISAGAVRFSGRREERKNAREVPMGRDTTASSTRSSILEAIEVFILRRPPAVLNWT